MNDTPINGTTPYLTSDDLDAADVADLAIVEPVEPAFPVVRRATIGDLAGLRLGLATMLAAHQMPYPTYNADDLALFTANAAERILSHDPTLGIAVAEGPDPLHLAGFAVGEVSERPIGQPRRFLMAHWLWVDPAYRHQRLGWALNRAVMDMLADSGVTTVEIAAKWGDDQWARRGWTPVATTYVLSLPDAERSLASRAPQETDT